MLVTGGMVSDAGGTHWLSLQMSVPLQVPQLNVPPHPFGSVPQLAAPAEQVVGMQGGATSSAEGVATTLGVPPPATSTRPSGKSAAENRLRATSRPALTAVQVPAAG